MDMLMDIRPIQTQQELNDARALLAPDALESDWASSFVLVENGVVAGLFCPCAKLYGKAILLEIEPLRIKHIGAGSIGLMFWADAHMRGLAQHNGLKGYTFVTENPAFQRFCERYLPVTWSSEGKGKRYYRIFS